MNIRVKITKDGGNAVRTMDLEEYLRGVLPSEMYASWPAAALRAGAIAARTYALDKVHIGRGKAYDVDDTSRYQRYNPAKTDARTDRAIQDTAGQVLTHNGKLLDTCVYCASNGGRILSPEGAWGSKRPYLVARDDPYDRRAGRKKNGHGIGMSQWGAAQMAKEGKDFEFVLNFYYPGAHLTLMHDL